MAYLGWLFAGLLIGWIGVFFARKGTFFGVSVSGESSDTVSALLAQHFMPRPTSSITIYERQFPFRVRADLQRAIDQLFGDDVKIVHFCGVRKEYSHEGVTLSDCIIDSQHNPTVSIPPEHEELDIGEDESIRVLKNGLWLLEKNGVPFAVLLAPASRYGCVTGLQFQIGTPNTPEGTQLAQEFFKHLEASIIRAESYRGKILSLEEAQHSYSGESSGIIELNGDGHINHVDIDAALDEMLFRGGLLNLKLLGASDHEPNTTPV